MNNKLDKNYKITIITVTKNSERHLEENILSVFNQTTTNIKPELDINLNNNKTNNKTNIDINNEIASGCVQISLFTTYIPVLLHRFKCIIRRNSMFFR